MGIKRSISIALIVFVAMCFCQDGESPSLIVPKDVSAAREEKAKKKAEVYTVKKLSYVQFNNPHLLSKLNKADKRSDKDSSSAGGNGSGKDGQSSTAASDQQRLDALYFGGADTKKLARRLKMEFHRLSQDELGSTTMQVELMFFHLYSLYRPPIYFG